MRVLTAILNTLIPVTLVGLGWVLFQLWNYSYYCAMWYPRFAYLRVPIYLGCAVFLLLAAAGLLANIGLVKVAVQTRWGSSLTILMMVVWRRLMAAFMVGLALGGFVFGRMIQAPGFVGFWTFVAIGITLCAYSWSGMVAANWRTAEAERELSLFDAAPLGAPSRASYRTQSTMPYNLSPASPSPGTM